MNIDCNITSTPLLVREITVVCHFRKNDLMLVIICKNDLMPVIICKNDKHLVTLYNVIFSHMTGHPLTFELYLLLTQEGSNVPLKLNVLGNLSA